MNASAETENRVCCLQQQKSNNIDLSESWMIGDGENDIEAGKNAGCKVCAVGDVETTMYLDIIVY